MTTVSEKAPAIDIPVLLRDQPLDSEGIIHDLEGRIRKDFRAVYPRRNRAGVTPADFPTAADRSRKAISGGDINHRFEGERYLNCVGADKWAQRMQLRKLIDEGGQVTVGGPQVAHPLLARWEANMYGVTMAEIDGLEMEDADPQGFVSRGWWISLQRNNYYGIAIGSGMVAEGETGQFSKELLAQIEIDRKTLKAAGVPDVDRGLMNRYEHAGVDVEHGEFNENVVRKSVNTPELQARMQTAFILRLQNNAGA
jgi:hypothetical protein